MIVSKRYFLDKRSKIKMKFLVCYSSSQISKNISRATPDSITLTTIFVKSSFSIYSMFNRQYFWYNSYVCIIGQ